MTLLSHTERGERHLLERRIEMDCPNCGLGLCVNKSCKAIAGYERNTACQQGAGATNALEALVSGTHFTFFIKGAKVGEFDDDSVGNGIVGLYAGPNVEASFTYLMIAQPADGGPYS